MNTNAIRHSWLSAPLRLLPGAIRRVQDEHNVCVTFDDGPHPVATPRVLAALKNTGMKATFFLTGEHAEAHPGLVKRIADEGHRIANHGYRHSRHIGKRGAIHRSIMQTQDCIGDILGVQPALFRPPYGWWLPTNNDLLRKNGLTLALWSLMPGDYRGSAQADTVSGMLRMNLRGGDIIVLHDNALTAEFIEQPVHDLSRLLQERFLGTRFITGEV